MPVKNFKGFTLVELIATIAILAILIGTMVPMIGNYVEAARQTADRQTLAVLNDALTRYKTQGGDISALTAGASIGDVLTALQTPVDWAGTTHQFLKTGATYSASSLSAMGTGAQYQFYGYGSYSDMDESEIPAGTPTSDAPYGKGVGYLERAGSSDGNITVRTSSDYAAYQINGGSTVIISATSGAFNNIAVPAGGNLKFWSCAGPADSSFSGGATELLCDYRNFNKIDVRSCTSLERLSCGDNDLTSLNVGNLTSLTYLNCAGNDITSLNVSGCTSLQRINCYYNNLTSLDVSGCTSLEQIDCYNNDLSSLNVTGLTALETIYCYYNNLTSLDVSGCPSFYYLSCHHNNLSSLDFSGLTAFRYFYGWDNNLSSLNVNGCTSLEVLYCYNNNISDLNISGLSALARLYCYSNNISTLDLSGLTAVYRIRYYDNPLTTSSSALNAFYNSLSAPSGGSGDLWENQSTPSSPVSVGQDTGLIPPGWVFSD